MKLLIDDTEIIAQPKYEIGDVFFDTLSEHHMSRRIVSIDKSCAMFSMFLYLLEDENGNVILRTESGLNQLKRIMQ
jgi:hypothetical protein